MKLEARVYTFTESTDRRLSYSSKDQIERAALSFSNNIAEGFERGTAPELLNFLSIARRSASEVRSMIYVFPKRPKLMDSKPEVAELCKLAAPLAEGLKLIPRASSKSDAMDPLRDLDGDLPGALSRKVYHSRNQAQNRQKSTEGGNGILPGDKSYKNEEQTCSNGRRDDTPGACRSGLLEVGIDYSLGSCDFVALACVPMLHHRLITPVFGSLSVQPSVETLDLVVTAHRLVGGVRIEIRAKERVIAIVLNGALLEHFPGRFFLPHRLLCNRRLVGG